jgi:L-asparagine transporter-like permease
LLRWDPTSSRQYLAYLSNSAAELILLAAADYFLHGLQQVVAEMVAAMAAEMVAEMVAEMAAEMAAKLELVQETLQQVQAVVGKD